jgi:hypothetical protein
VTDDLETLRRHEAALRRVRASDGAADTVGEERAAIDWSLARVRDAIAKMESPLDDWRPIETAPHDGTRVLVLIPPGADGRRSVEIAAWDDERFNKRPHPFWAWERRFLGVATMKDMPPTHWMPLPEVPR